MSKKSKNIARFIRAAMGTYPNLRPYAAVTHYGAWLMSENKRLKKMLLSCGVQMETTPRTQEKGQTDE